MRITLACLALIVLGALPVGTHAADGLTFSTAYQSHPVRGTTAAELLRDMTLHPIIDPDGGPSFANITHAHSLELSTAAAGELCRVQNLAFDWQFVITVPEAIEETALAPATRSKWRALVATLKAHEEHHRAIFLDCAHSFVPAAAGLTAKTCPALDAAVRRLVNAEYAACMARQKAFDVRDHPRIMSTPFMREANAR